MTTIGDVLMVFGGVAAFGFGAWCLVLVLNLLFPGVTDRATSLFERRPGGQLGSGLVLGLPVLLIDFILVSNPVPLLKVAGVVVLLAVLAVGGVGFAGLAKLCSQRVKGFGGSANDYQSLTRGTALLVGACLLPFFGWFVLAPLCLLACVGAGVSTLRRPVSTPVSAGEAQP